MSKEKYLIINADDYGYNMESNVAITELFARGGITASSILAVAPASKDAVQTAARNGYAVGIHFAFNSDDSVRRWQSLTRAPSLNDAKGLPDKALHITLHAKSAEIRREMDAQYQYLLRGGCVPDHADSHCGTLYGLCGRLFFVQAFRFCCAHSLPLSLPRKPYFLDRLFDGKTPAPILPLHRAMVALADKMGVLLTDDMVSHPHGMARIPDYDALRDYYLNELRKLRPGISELFLHPAKPVAGTDDTRGEWTKREYEYRLLQSGDLLQAARDAGVQVVSWGDAPFAVGGK